MTVTVAIPVRNGGELLRDTLEAVLAQQLDQEVELLICDSGSRDGSVSVARSLGARVIEIPAERFSHGGTRNLLMENAAGSHVAFLTQDATPAGERWLADLLDGFALAENVGLVFGPQLAREGASPMVARELASWFGSLSEPGKPRIDRLAESERLLADRCLLGPRGFFSDANSCVLKTAWQQVRFQPVAYAEDQRLALDMLRAGYAKVYVPDAAVVHSHEYAGWDRLRRSFDEARSMVEIYGFSEPGEPRRAVRNLWGAVGADRRWAMSDPRVANSKPRQLRLLVRATVHHLLRTLGTMLGTRANRLSPRLVGHLSLEGRQR